MISTVLSDSVPVLDNEFTPCNASEDLFSILNLSSRPVDLNPGLERTNTCQILNQNYSSNIGFKENHLNHTGLKFERRKKSNRESARRSRMKKQKHLEDVRSQVNQLKIENRELVNRFRYVMHHCQRAIMENDSLRLEQRVLHEKLLNLRHALVLKQIQQSSTCATWSDVNSTVVTVQQNPSMIRDHVI